MHDPLRHHLEENIGKTLSDIHHSRILYGPHPRILEIKAKINKCDLIKLKIFGTFFDCVVYFSGIELHEMLIYFGD